MYFLQWHDTHWAHGTVYWEKGQTARKLPLKSIIARVYRLIPNVAGRRMRITGWLAGWRDATRSGGHNMKMATSAYTMSRNGTGHHTKVHGYVRFVFVVTVKARWVSGWSYHQQHWPPPPVYGMAILKACCLCCCYVVRREPTPGLLTSQHPICVT